MPPLVSVFFLSQLLGFICSISEAQRLTGFPLTSFLCVIYLVMAKGPSKGVLRAVIVTPLLLFWAGLWGLTERKLAVQ